MSAPEFETYGAAVDAMRRLRDSGDESAAVAAGERLGRAMAAPNDALLALTRRTTPGDPALGHAVNTAVLACAAARAAGWSAEELQALAVWGLLHDWKRGTEPDASLSPEERDSELHPSAASALFEQAAALETVPIPHVRRLDARIQPPQTRPSGQTRRPTNLAALILALSHMHESLTHPRAWRAAQAPHVIFMRLLNHLQRERDDALIAAFTRGVTLYPPGALVELSDGRIGAVAAINPDSPAQPRIRVRSAGEGERPEAELDLAADGAPAVKRSLPAGESIGAGLQNSIRTASELWWF